MKATQSIYTEASYEYLSTILFHKYVVYSHVILVEIQKEQYSHCAKTVVVAVVWHGVNELKAVFLVQCFQPKIKLFPCSVQMENLFNCSEDM